MTEPPSGTGAGFALNPQATHPPFAWRVDLPADAAWTVLDTHPASWQRSADRLVDDRFAGTHLKTADRKAIVSVVADLVTSCQQGNVLLSLVRVGLDSDERFDTTGLHLAWYDSSPQPASLSTVRQAIARQGLTEEFATPAGTVLVQRDYQSVTSPATPPPGGRPARLGLISLQAFLPIAGRCWTAVIASATTSERSAQALHDIVLTVAASIEILGGGSPTDPPEPIDPTDTGSSTLDGDYVPVPTAAEPGIQRGFGTWVSHRVDPAGSRTEPSTS